MTSEWGTPNTMRTGWCRRSCSALNTDAGSISGTSKRKHLQEIDFGPDYQLVFELRPAHDPTKAYGFVNCVVSLKDLSASIWCWHRDGDKWAVRR